ACVASKLETRSEISTISRTPASRARAMTASRSSSNCGAWRLTWLSMSIERLSSRPQRLELAECRPEHVVAIEVYRLGFTWDLYNARPELRPRVDARGRRAPGHAGSDRLAQALEEELETPLPLLAAERVGQRQQRGLRRRVALDQRLGGLVELERGPG